MSFMPLKKETIEYDAGLLSFVISPGTGPVIILIPGSFANHRDFVYVLRELDPMFTVVIVELPGHGDSWPPPKNGSVEGLAESVFRVTDSLKLNSFYVAGHSIGGMIAMQMGKARPYKIKGIISIEGWTDYKVVDEAFGGIVENTLSPDLTKIQQSNRVQVYSKWTQKQIEDFSEIWKQWDGYTFLLTTDIPILSVWGDRGNVRPDISKLHIPERKNIKVKWFSNASHFLNLECPKELAESINCFISFVENEYSTKE